MTAKMLKNTMLLFSVLFSGSAATTLNQAVVPAKIVIESGRTGGSFHHMTPDGKVRGEYEVELPDGRTQHVVYTAGHDQGYVANISYKGEAKYPTVPQYFAFGSSTGTHRPPPWTLGTPSSKYGGRIKGKTLKKSKPQKLTPTPVKIQSSKRTKGRVSSERQYGYKSRYPQTFMKVSDRFDSTYNFKEPLSHIQPSDRSDINNGRDDRLQSKQQVKENIFSASKHYPIGSTTITPPTSTSSPTTTLDPYYSHYGQSARHFKKLSRYSTKDSSPMSFSREPPAYGLVTEYEKSNTIKGIGIPKPSPRKESEPLYIPKYFDFALKKLPQPYTKL